MPSRPLQIPLPDIDAAAAFLRDGADFLVTSHVNSDGDGVGSGLALVRLLRQLGKKATLILQDRPADGFAFLEGWDEIVLAGDARAGRWPWAVTLDCPTRDRIGATEGLLAEGARLLNIDHHLDNSLFGTVNLVSGAVCSTSEMVYHLATHLGLVIDATAAESLYAGILFDTGGFRYSLTTATSMEVGADLVRRGARFDVIADRLYNNATFDSVKLIGRAIDSMELHGDGRIATLRLSREEMQHGDPEATVNYGLMVRGVEVTVLLKEETPGQFRISLRSREAVDVSAIAHQFGGGGHARAAGCRQQGDLDGIRSRLLAAIAEALP